MNLSSMYLVCLSLSSQLTENLENKIMFDFMNLSYREVNSSFHGSLGRKELDWSSNTTVLREQVDLAVIETSGQTSGFSC